MVPQRPFFSGRPGWVRSSAWIWLFSSTANTSALSGGLRYRPMMSCTFSAKCLSFDSLKVFLITHHPQPNPGIAKRQGISVLEPSEGCLLYPSPLFQPEFQPAATCQGRVQRARSGGLQGLGKVRMAEDGA